MSLALEWVDGHSSSCCYTIILKRKLCVL